MSTFKFDKIRIDPVGLGIAGNGILGIKDSGKSYTATELAEHIFDAGIPFVAFDPTGIWKFMRVPGKGKGRPVVVVGMGEDADLRLSPSTISQVIEAAMQSGVSLVIDLSHMDLSKADWRRIVRDGVKTLLHKNEPHGLRHIFLEEAAEFVPQKVNDGLVYAEVEKLARVGGNSRLGYTLINQRAEEVNKAVLELCDNLFLHRQKGKNSLLSLRKWMDVADVEEGNAIINTLSTLPTGQCWAWLRESDRPVLCRVPEKDSFHPDRRAVRGSVIFKTAQPVDVAGFVSKLQGQLPAIEAYEKANDPVLLRKRITELEKQLRSGGEQRSLNMAESQVVYDKGYREGSEAMRVEYRKRIDLYKQALQPAMVALSEREPLLPEPKFPAPDTRHNQGRSPQPAAPIVPKVSPPSPSRRGAGGNGALGKAERLILTALAQAGVALPVERVAAIAGYAVKGGGFNNALGALRSKGYIELGQPLTINRDGLDALGTFDPLPIGHELLQYWRGKVGKAERSILDAAARGLTSKEEIAAEAGYEPSGGGFNNALGRLRTLGLISGRGAIELHEDLR